MSNRNRWIMGSAIGLATIAVAIDHTRHSLPEAESYQSTVQGEAESPCAMDSPCTMDMDSSPCSMDDISSPCSL